MTHENVEMETLTPPDNDTDAILGPAESTSDHHAKIGPILAEVLEDLAKSERGKQDTESLREWIKIATGQGLDMRHDGGQTLLHAAAVNGLSEAAKKLLDVYSDLNVPEERKRTPLFEACFNGHADIVKLLLDNGADTALADEDDETPLHIAARNGNLPIVGLLLSNSKKTLNDRSKFYKWTPLHVAASHGHEDIISYLRDQGARLDLQDEDGWTPLWTAVTGQQTRAIKALIEKKKETENLQLDTGDTEAQTPLMEAARWGFLEGVRLLVKAGAKCDKSESTDATREDTALHLAVSTDQCDIVKFLLKPDANINVSGANVNARNAEGQHCSHLASIRGNKDILELLLNAQGCSGLDARDDDGMTPLHIASSAGNPDHDDQESPDVAVSVQTEENASTSGTGRYIEVVRLLLQRGADITAATKANKTALELAFESKHHKRWEAILSSLEEMSDRFSQALLRAASNTEGHKMAIAILQKQPEQPETLFPKKEDWTAIEWAAYTKSPDALWLLIASSPKIEETDLALDRVRQWLKEEDQLPKSTTTTRDQKHEKVDDRKRPDITKKPYDTKKSDERAKKVKLIRNHINNPPTGIMYNDSQEYSTPNLDEDFLRWLKEYKATIVQFHKQQGRFARIRRSQTVKETIYSDGPREIMNDVVSILERLAKGEIEQRSPGTAFMGPKSQFTWIHLPATNMTWMDDLLQRVMKDQDRSSSNFNQAKSFFKDSWIQVPDKVSPSRIMRPRCVWRNATENGTLSEDTNAKGSAEQKSTDDQNKVGAVAPPLAATAIYMPYFSYSFEYCDEDHSSSKPETTSKVSEPHEETDTRQTEVEDTPSKKPTTASKVSKPHKETDTRQTEAEDIPSKKPPTATEKDIETNFGNNLKSKRIQYQSLLDAYKEKIIHGSSTLDESLPLWSRRRVPKRQDQAQQLWMWTIDDKWLISASSHPIDDHENELLDGILDLLEKQGEAGGSDLQPSSASEMSQFIVDYCVESYERKPKGINKVRPEHCRLEDLLSIRQTFSDSINSIARAETDLFEKFSRLTKELRATSPLEAQSKDSQGRSLYTQLTDATFDAEELSGKVKDILDELNSLESTVHYQQDVQRSMKALKSMKKQALQMGMKEIKKSNVPETDLSATYIIKDINRLDSVAKRVHDAVNTTLSLQQSEVSNLQAKLSIAQADASAQQSRVVMIFTVVTILFLPLSFLTSFFALDVSTFQAPAWAVGTIFAVSIAFFIPTVMLAFTVKRSISFLVGLLGFVTTKTLQFICYIREKHAGSRASPQGADQSRIHPTGPQQTGNGKRDSSDRKRDDLEMGHGVSGRST